MKDIVYSESVEVVTVAKWTCNHCDVPNYQNENLPLCHGDTLFCDNCGEYSDFIESSYSQDYLKSNLKVGTRIKIGAKFNELICDERFENGEIIELIKGEFENDNGGFCHSETAPSIWNDEDKDFDSIYHLFGNNLEDFIDCEIIK